MNRMAIPGELLEKERVYFLFERDGAVWFANNSILTITEARGSDGGFQTCGDDVVTLNSKSRKYENVMPGEAVSIAIAPDGFLDLDFLIEYYVDIVLAGGEVKSLRSGLNKGGYPNATLEWEPLPPETEVDLNSLAQSYIDSTKKYIPAAKFINQGDIIYGFVNEKISDADLNISIKKFHGGSVVMYEVSQYEGLLWLSTYSAAKVLKFLSYLKR